MFRACMAAIFSAQGGGGGGAVTITGTPTAAKIGTPYTFAFTVNGPVRIVAGAADLTEVGLSVDSAGAFSGTP